jgi:hypothetical protein
VLIEGLVEPEVPLVVARGFVRTIWAVRLEVRGIADPDVGGPIEDVPIALLTDFRGTPRDFGHGNPSAQWNTTGTVLLGQRLQQVWVSSWWAPNVNASNRLFIHQLAEMDVTSWV